MAHRIVFNPDSVRTAMNNLLLEMESGGEGSLTNMQSNVKRFTVNGAQESNGGVESLSMLTVRLRASLSLRSNDALALYNELSDALEALELIISDLNAREDDQSQKSADMLTNIQELMQTSVENTTTTPAGTSSGNPTGDDIRAGGFGTGSGDASA